MVRYFLKKANRFSLLFTLFYCTSTLLLFADQTAESSVADTTAQQEAPAFSDHAEVLSVEACEAALAGYYRDKTIDRKRLFSSFDRIHEAMNTDSTDGEQLLSYLEHAKLISVLYTHGGDRKCKKYLKHIDGQAPVFLQEVMQQNGTTEKPLTNTQISALYLRYADFLYTKLMLPGNALSIAASLPVLYRKALLLNPDNTEALVKLACWHIFPADATTTRYNSFIESQEAYLEELSLADQGTAYLMYSIYYMKKYDSKKGRAYLAKAAALFPNHVLVLHLYDNYKKGIFAL